MMYPTLEQLKSISEDIEMGYTVYYKKDNGRIIAIPSGMDEDQDPYEDWKEDIKEVEGNIDAYIIVEPLSSHDSFEIMELFATQVDNDTLRDKLLKALNTRKPFLNFRNVIDEDSDIRQAWFNFKQFKLEEYVSEQFEIDLNDINE